MNWKEIVIIVVVMVLNKNFTSSFSPTQFHLVNGTGMVVADMTSEPKKIALHAIQKWSELGIGLSRTRVSIDSQSLIEVIKLLAAAVPYIGVILPNLIDILHKPPDEVAEIRTQLLEMESHLFAVENKINALSQQIIDVDILSYFKSESKSINFLHDHFRRYIEESNVTTFSVLIKSCEEYNVLNYVYYVENELGDGITVLTLWPTMLADLDLKNFQLWMKMLTASISQSMLLHITCMVTQYNNNSDLESTLHADLIYFEKIANLLLKTTQDGTTHIFENYFENVKAHVEYFAMISISKSHQEFASQLFSFLQEKFFFRNWFVFSYDPVWTDENHWITTGSQYVASWFRMSNRNIQVAHTNNLVSGELYQLYTDATSQPPLEVRCDHIYETIEEYLGGSFNSIAVLQSTELSDDSFSAQYRYAYHTTKQFKYIQSWRNKFYEVYIVPGEK